MPTQRSRARITARVASTNGTVGHLPENGFQIEDASLREQQSSLKRKKALAFAKASKLTLFGIA